MDFNIVLFYVMCLLFWGFLSTSPGTTSHQLTGAIIFNYATERNEYITSNQDWLLLRGQKCAKETFPTLLHHHQSGLLTQGRLVP